MRRSRLIPVLAFSILLSAIPMSVSAEDRKEIQEIRERLIRIEERMVTKEELKAEIKDVRTEIKDVGTEIKEFMLFGFGVTFAGIFALIGFVLWDRRPALAPAVKKARELEEREERVEKALKEIALKDGNVREALRHVGLLTD